MLAQAIRERRRRRRENEDGGGSNRNGEDELLRSGESILNWQLRKGYRVGRKANVKCRKVARTWAFSFVGNCIYIVLIVVS
jgi:hypothetical protein